MSKRISKSLVVNGVTLVSESDWNAELEAKHQKLVEWLKANKHAGIVLRRNENIAWVTGGAVEEIVSSACETGVASVLVTAAGGRYYLTTENEAARAHDEEFGKLDFEPVIFPWFTDETLARAEKLAGGPVVTDATANIYPLRQALSESEIARYRWLGAESAAATVEALNEVAPGMSEYDLEAITTANLFRRGILPTVHLYAADERILKYKHAVPRGAVVKKFAMLNLCSRKFGLVISITRFVHFGALPAELAARFQAAAKVNAALIEASKPGATASEIYKIAAAAYKAEGFEGDERAHHQGGAAGYNEREWVATPAGTQVVVDSQAFAWNPSIRGGKTEDTVVVKGGKAEWLTSTPTLPVIDVERNGKHYPAAGVLVK
jgi:antitoxin VapB